MRGERIILPIPPGTHWSDAKPIVLPRGGVPGTPGPSPVQIEDKSHGRAERATKTAVVKSATIATNGLRLGEPVAPLKRKEKKPRVKLKNDPAHVAAARELRDRYLEQFNSGLVLPGGKYDVCRVIDAKPAKPQAMVEAKMIAA